MRLTPTQVNRFYQLFDGFVAFAACRLGMRSPFAALGETDDRAILDVTEAVWGEAGQRELVAAYVAENPDRLSRSALRSIAAWSEGVYADFAVVRDGRDFVFLHGGHAFAVRGLSREVDEVTGPVPTFASTAILPFDDHITYGTCVSTLPVHIGPTMATNLAEEAAECRREGRLASTSRQFARLAPLARKAALDHAAEDFAHRTELEMNAHELAHDQHEGVLACLSWEDRQAAVEHHLHELREASGGLSHEEILGMVDATCQPGASATTMRGLLVKLDKDRLLELATGLGAQGVGPRTGKAKLADAVLAQGLDETAMLDPVVLDGPHALTSVRRVFEAGGRIEVPLDAVTKLNDVPEPTFPALCLYRTESGYVAQITDEVMALLAEADWDALAARAEAFEGVMRVLDLMVDLRGVVPLVDAIGEAANLVGLPEEDYLQLLLGIRLRIDGEQLGFDMAEVDGESYLVSLSVAEPDEEGFLSEEDEDLVGYILDEQLGKEPRPVEEVPEAYVRAIDEALGRPPARELAVYLDAHVPDGRDDYLFADDVVEELAFIAQGPLDPETLTYMLERLGDFGFVPTEAQLNHLLGLLMAFVNDIPKWTNNGWAPGELAAR